MVCILSVIFLDDLSQMNEASITYTKQVSLINSSLYYILLTK